MEVDTNDQNNFEKNLMQYIILFGTFNYFLKYPKIRRESEDKYVLENLNTLLKNMKDIAPAHPMITLKCVKLINALAFKNTMEVRRQMKTFGMFDMRDGLIIEYLTSVGIILIDQ